jgi:hypothetical protein
MICSMSASYLDLVLELTANYIATHPYDKRSDFNFPIVDSPYLCSIILFSPRYDVYISQLI